MLDTAAYLARIGHAGPTAPTLATLRALHHAHMLAVPFENLDIGLGRPIVLDEGALLAKVVAQRRGGFCYELNGLFAALLRTLGFRVTLLSAGVRANPTTEAPVFNQDYDHLCLRVDLDEPWLVDVGFGDSFLHPIRLAPATEQIDSGREEPLGTTPVAAIWSDHYRIVEAEPWRQLQRRDWRGGWQDRYRFTPTPRAWDDFVPMCHYHQTSPESGFTRRRTCTIATPTGRVTVGESHLVITTGTVRQETTFTDDVARVQALREYCGIVLPEASAPAIARQ